MRVRFLIDAEVDDRQLAPIAEMVAEQPPADLCIHSNIGPVYYPTRFMGAQQVLASE
jgi:hypothetical protein